MKQLYSPISRIPSERANTFQVLQMRDAFASASWMLYGVNLQRFADLHSRKATRIRSLSIRLRRVLQEQCPQPIG